MQKQVRNEKTGQGREMDTTKSSGSNIK